MTSHSHSMIFLSLLPDCNLLVSLALLKAQRIKDPQARCKTFIKITGVHFYLAVLSAYIVKEPSMKF